MHYFFKDLLSALSSVASSDDRRPHYLPWLVGFCLLIPTVIGGCQGSTSVDESSLDVIAAGEAPSQVTVVNLRRIDIRKTIDLPISLQGYERTKLVPRIEGLVNRVHVDIGDEVAEGQLLIDLKVPELEAECHRREALLTQARVERRSAEAKLEQAKSHRDEQLALQQLRDSEYVRVSNLVKKGALSRDKEEEAKFAVESAIAARARVEADIKAAAAEVDSAIAAIDVAQAELDKSKSMLAFKDIKAPFAGVITKRNVDPGAFVVPSTDKDKVLLQIERVSKLRGVMYAPISNAAEFDLDQPVTLHAIAGIPNVEISADADGKPIVISRSSNVLNAETRLMRSEIEVVPPLNPQTGKSMLRPGDYATAKVVLKTFPQQPAVPASAIGDDAQGLFIVFLSDDLVCRKLPVEIVAESGDWQGIQAVDRAQQERLVAGARVLTGNLSVFRDGQKLDDDVDIQPLKTE